MVARDRIPARRANGTASPISAGAIGTTPLAPTAVDSHSDERARTMDQRGSSGEQGEGGQRREDHRSPSRPVRLRPPHQRHRPIGHQVRRYRHPTTPSVVEKDRASCGRIGAIMNARAKIKNAAAVSIVSIARGMTV
jgi:hypothetical protein